MSGSHPAFIRDYVWHRPLNPLSIKLCVWPLYTVTGYWLLINLLIDQFTNISNITTGNKCIIFGLPDLVWIVMWIIERQFCGSWWKMKEVSGMQHGSHHNCVIIQLFIKSDRQSRNTAQYIVLISVFSEIKNVLCDECPNQFISTNQNMKCIEFQRATKRSCRQQATYPVTRPDGITIRRIWP